MKKVCLSSLFVFYFLSSNAQSNVFLTFWHLKSPEKIWVVSHFNEAYTSYKISRFARKSTDSLIQCRCLDADGDGGQMDAFRHAYWMALLAQHISISSARDLGKAHEKSNFKSFKQHQKEDNGTPDWVSSEMDLYNNEVGLYLGCLFPNLTPDSLRNLVINEVIKGSMKIIYKDKMGKSLMPNGSIIHPDSLQHRWKTPRVLVPSNQERP